MLPRSESAGAGARSTPEREPVGLAVGQALILGALQGPAELLPISSSGHVALLPWLAGWEYAHADPEVRKAFEVVLHAGTAAALLITLRHELEDAARGMTPQRAGRIGLSFLPPAAVGFALERPIERRLGTPATIAAGLIGGSIAMAVAERAPESRRSSSSGAIDALWLGAAQALALIPGVSRSGATLAAARMRRFTRRDAHQLSRDAALPVIAGAGALKIVRLVQRGIPPGSGVAMAAGAGASFVSTLVSFWLITHRDRGRSLTPYAAYRLTLAAVVLGAMRTRGRPLES
ncbi:MAG: undecaprenyl-diphosphate phosphatase [Solirubrobacteraceae bacterium]